MRRIKIILMGLSLLLSKVIIANETLLVIDDIKNEVAEKLAEDIGFENAVNEIFTFQMKLSSINVKSFNQKLQSQIATENDWHEFLSKIGYESKENYFSFLKQLFEKQSNSLKKYLADYTIEDKKKIITIASKIFAEKNFDKISNKAAIPDCLSAWIAGVGLCTANYELLIALGDPNALLYWSLCLAANSALYVICDNS